ncbi:MAG TPA: hypothetical protein VFJ46_17750 [Xanthobacteraceae bacterium]|nr:hypothetical protein [Xanthobacteraceae bacterium]
MNAHGHFLTEGSERGGRKRSPYARTADVERLIKAAKRAGLDVGGFDALPDGTVRIFTADAQKKSTLFDELDGAGKL